MADKTHCQFNACHYRCRTYVWTQLIFTLGTKCLNLLEETIKIRLSTCACLYTASKLKINLIRKSLILYIIINVMIRNIQTCILFRTAQNLDPNAIVMWSNVIALNYYLKNSNSGWKHWTNQVLPWHGPPCTLREVSITTNDTFLDYSTVTWLTLLSFVFINNLEVSRTLKKKNRKHCELIK